MRTLQRSRGARLTGAALAGALLASTMYAARSTAATAQDAAAASRIAPERASRGRDLNALREQVEALAREVRELARQNRTLIEQNSALAAREQALEASVARSAGAASGNAPAAPAGSDASAAAAGSSLLPPASAVASGSAQAAGSVLPAGSAVPPGLANTSLWGYGEIYYTDPVRPGTRAEADLARAVFGLGHSFGPRTEFNSEFEVEHAVASAEDKGEFEVEQFYVDQRLADRVTLRAGLFLMPFGFLNEHHEPTSFYGVQRNFVETLIIPSTWREGGLNLHGESGAGFGWNVGVTTGFNLSGWNFMPEFPPYTTALDLETSGVAPLQATHQELSEADAHSLSQYVALGYFGVPGLTLGGAIFTGEAAPVPSPPNAPLPGSQRVTLWEGHVRWTPGRLDLSALYARGTIGNLAAINASVPGAPNPIPSSFDGYYFQAAYDLWDRGDLRLAPFARWEHYDLGARFAGTSGPDIPSGLIPLSASPGAYGYWPIDRDSVWTVGANFYVTSGVVLKADYQRFRQNADFTRFDLGLGLNF